MTLNEIELDVFRRLDYADSPPTSVKARIDGFINQRHRQLLASDRMRPLRMATTTLVTVANLPSYGLPYGCARISRVMDQTNDFMLSTRSYEWARQQYPDLSTASGTPEAWIPLGFAPVTTRPFQAAGLWIVASNATPGTGLIFTLVLVGQGGQTLTLHPALNATPTTRQPITLPGGFTPTDILDFYVNKPLTADVGIYDSATAGNLVSQIATDQTTARYYRIGFVPVPGSAITYWIDYEREIPALVDPYDEPLLPIDFHDIIALLARMDEYEFKSDDRWMTTRTLVDERKRELRAWVENHDTFRVTAIPTTPSRSRLGPYFPAGT